jgi:hypothetical protein
MVPDVSKERVVFMYMVFSINTEPSKIKATRSVANPDPKVRSSGTVQNVLSITVRLELTTESRYATGHPPFKRQETLAKRRI